MNGNAWIKKQIIKHFGKKNYQTFWVEKFPMKSLGYFNLATYCEHKKVSSLVFRNRKPTLPKFMDHKVEKLHSIFTLEKNELTNLY